MSANESGSPDWDAVTHELRAAVRAAGGREREVIALGVAAGRRAGRGLDRGEAAPASGHGSKLRPDHHGLCATAMLQHAALRLRYGVAIPTVLKDLKR